MTAPRRDAVADLMSRVPTGLFLDGTFQEAADSRRFDVLNPATGEVLASVASAGPADGERALEVAQAAQRQWARTRARTRADILARAYELCVTTYRDDLAMLMTLEMGKPLDQAHAEVTYGAAFLRWFAEETVRIRGDYFPLPEGHLHALTVRRPVGPCLFITPWNFPLAMATRKAGPAFAAGCVALLKPSQDTPLTSLYFAKIMAEAGLPAGVLAVLPSDRTREVTGPMIADPRLRKLSFTGSTAVGRALLRECADGVLRTSMELGGNAPFMVFEDADLDAAVEAAAVTKMRNMGQACNAADHFFVHTSLYEAFAQRLAARLGAMRVGDGLEEGVEVGPLVSERQRDGVAAMVAGAVASGARVLTGGQVPDGPGFFYPPTVVVDVDPASPLVTQEIFGPVAPVMPFEDEQELVDLVNKDLVGLTAYAHTSSMERVARLAHSVEVGMLGINSATISNAAAPFGGVKQSGLGREGGKEGIEEYLETVYVGLPAPRW